VENGIQLAQMPGLILCCYGDLLRVPAANGMSLLKAKAHGADVRMVYSSADAVKIAQENPQRQVVFFAIGFETTTPPTAVAIKQAQALDLKNFSVFCNHVLTPSAISHILQSPEIRQLGVLTLDGFIGPAHVSTVIGSRPYEYFAEEFQKKFPCRIRTHKKFGTAIILFSDGTKVDVATARLEIYEAPAAWSLTTAHKALESLVLDRETLHFKELIALKYAELVYYGLWYTPLKSSKN